MTPASLGYFVNTGRPGNNQRQVGTLVSLHTDELPFFQVNRRCLRQEDLLKRDIGVLQEGEGLVDNILACSIQQSGQSTIFDADSNTELL